MCIGGCKAPLLRKGDNSMLRIYSKKGFRIWSILLIFCIVLSVFACSVSQANANPIVVAGVTLGVLGAVAVSMGVGFEGVSYDNTESFLNNVYNYLQYDTRQELLSVALAGYTVFKLSQQAFNDVADSISNFLVEQYQAFTQTGQYAVIGTISTTADVLYSAGGLTYFGFDEGQQFEKLSGLSYGTENCIYQLEGNTAILTKPIVVGTTYANIDQLEYSQITIKALNQISFGSPVYQIISHVLRSSGNYITQTVDIRLDNYNSSMATPFYENGVATPTLVYYPEYVNQRILDNAIDDGIIGEQDIASGVGANSIDYDIPITIPVQGLGDDVITDVNTWTPSDVVIPGAVAQDVPISITGEAEIIGDGTGTGIFGDIGKWILNIPILGSILQLLINILQAIQSLTAVSDFTLDFSPLKIGLTEVFPFCIPFDLLRMVTVYSATPDDFVFTIDLETDYFVVDHEVDLSPFSIPIIFFRWVVTIWFSWILISRTRDMIKW
jgi:hypothetical protein